MPEMSIQLLEGFPLLIHSIQFALPNSKIIDVVNVPVDDSTI
jgi:CMP-N-acetylneuraminic acid synthetase